MYNSLNIILIVVAAAVISYFLFCRLVKVSEEVVRYREKEIPRILYPMQFSE